MYYMIGGFTLDDTVLANGTVEWAAPGGNALYAAVGARVWTDQVGIVALVGSDYPQRHLDRLSVAGFDLTGVRRIEHPSFHVWILHEGGGRRQILYRLDSGINAALDPRPEDLPEGVALAAGVHVCPILGVSQTALIEHLVDRKIPTTLDLIVIPNQIDVSRGHRPDLWGSLRALLPSIEEVRALFGDLPLRQLIARLQEVSPTAFAIKLGEHGSLVHHPGEGGIYHVPAYPTDVVDATGAGDSFCGGFLVGLQDIGDPIEAALRGTVSASFVIEGYGALHALDATRTSAEERLKVLRPEVRLLEHSLLKDSIEI